MANLLPSVVVENNGQPDAAVIWLHGLGSDGHDFESLVPALTLPENLSIRFVFPHAPIRPVTVNGGMEMRAWYDIYEMNIERKVDSANILESCESIEALIEDQIRQGISAERIILAGFSQGGVIAYQTALTTKHKLAGVLALSTYLADESVVPDASDCVNGEIPFVIHHGSLDPVVPPVLAEKARSVLAAKGFTISSKDYEMPHSVCPEQVGDISRWVTENLA
ncbi:alpha/beta hydrolase [Marinomonas sp. C2222]|uniref:Alpha/beta hydrolase n=1 Tax=Marinomonas sargassi TaxID=2984494 RepID=A0ABT2YU90_9GAMM|nr:alpha/beta hydrolase [Marinomonas sargassi]MCV2403471.1 alpha/beta hydrolase [Marinomonas sargassi]